MPSSIGNLRCLETLDLRIDLDRSVSPYIPRVPNVFKYMKQLKHLYLPFEYRVCGKLELANLSYLQTLLNVQLNTIQIPTWCKLNRLRVLKVRNNKRAQDAMQMLISRCPLVEKLNLCNRIKKLPEVQKFSQNLAKLTLCDTCLEEDPMPTLEKLLNLKILRLLRYSFKGKDMVCSKGGFPLLQYLLLSELDKLEKWSMKEGAMPSLCHLIISDCDNLKILDGLMFVTTLQELKLDKKDRLHEVRHVPPLYLKTVTKTMTKNVQQLQ